MEHDRPYRLSDLAADSEHEAYMEGAEAGFWRGFLAGATACRQYIMNESDASPHHMVPERFLPLGDDWYSFDHSRDEETR